MPSMIKSTELAFLNVPLYSELPTAVDLFVNAVNGNEAQAILDILMPTFYNGVNQNLHTTTQGVTVQYSKDGKTWGDAPEVKNADLSYLEVVLGALDSIAPLLENHSDLKDILEPFAEPLEKIMNSLVYVKVTRGTTTSYGVVAPIVLPREFIVEYKNSQLNFAPGKNLTSKDVLEAKAINGYEALSSALNTYAKGVYDEDKKSQYDDVSRIIDTVISALGLLKTEKAGFCDADKAYAEKFVEKYFSLKNMPTTGKDNKLVFAKNVKIDFNALLADMKTDAELVTFLNNYDLLPEIMMLDLSSLEELPLGAQIDLSTFITSLGSQQVVVNTDVVKLLKSLLGLVDTGVLSTATVNFDKDFTQITAKNVTKKFHVKKAKTLAKKKTFKFKATTDYGTLEFKKLSGNKKITVRDDGKITVKKGLKKGTYTVRVKVSVPEAGKYVKKSVKVKIVK